VLTQTDPHPRQQVARIPPRPLLLAAFALVLVTLTGILLLHGSTWSARSPHGTSQLRHPATAARQSLTLTVEPDHLGEAFALGAVGLSIEADELTTQDLSTNDRSLVELMRQLGPGVLRLGGSSLDRSWWTNGGEAAPLWADSVITPSDLMTLRNLLAATGWRAILGVDFGHFDPDRAANEALVADHILGSRLLGLEIGNEPNAYGAARVALRPASYDVTDYLDELTGYSNAIRSLAPTVQLYGPDLSSQTWLPTIASDKNIPFSVITQHYDPTSYSVASPSCSGTAIPTARELLSPQILDAENMTLRSLVTAGKTAHRETMITETNTTASCDTDGGPDTSPVFASALWSLDWALRAASAGVSGLNFHGYFGRCGPDTVSPICAPGYAAEARGQVAARPEYYGLLVARQLEGGRFLPVNRSDSNTNAGITTYATEHPNGEITLVIDDLGANGPATLRLRVAGYQHATSESLVAPSLSATTHITFGGASANPVGLVQSRPARLTGRGDLFNLHIASAKAFLITLSK
jgi:hypothetical protein